MRKRGYVAGISMACCILMMGLCACGKENAKEEKTDYETEKQVTETDSDEAIEAFTITPEYTKEDLDEEYTDESYVTVTCNAEGITLSEETSGITQEDGVITITEKGTYVFTGEWNGSICVNTKDKGLVNIVCSNITVTGKDTVPLDIEQAQKVVLTLEKGTTNQIINQAELLEDTGTDDSNNDTKKQAAIYSKDDLTVNGTGTLSIISEQMAGIKCNDGLKIIHATVSIDSAKDGIIGKDYVITKDATIDITAGEDGIKSTLAEYEKGYVYLESSKITVTSENDGIQAETCLFVEDGTYEITTGGGSENAEVHTNNDEPFLEQGGRWNRIPSDDNSEQQPPSDRSGDDNLELPTPPDRSGDDNVKMQTPPERSSDDSQKNYPKMSDRKEERSEYEKQETDSDELTSTESELEETESTSAKAYKAGIAITITDGDITVDAKDDGIHSNRFVTITGGAYTIASGDDGIHADENLTIEDGLIEIIRCYEGLEAFEIIINGGEISLTASDDGINASGTEQTNPPCLTVNGGTISVQAEGDGLDSNGNIIMNGGEVFIDGPTNGGNGAIDYEYSCTVNGGTLFAIGSSSMSEGPTSESGLSYIHEKLSTTYDANAVIVIKDSEKKEIFQYQSAKSFQAIVFASDAIVSGENYTIEINGEQVLECTIK